jgi:DNA mismatch repair ATPase MutS
VFRYQLVPGPCPKSYGLHVAALAGIPEATCTIAAEVGAAFESRMSRLFQKTSHLSVRADEAANVDTTGQENKECVEAWENEDLALLVPWVHRVLSGTAADLRGAALSVRRLLPALGVV